MGVGGGHDPVTSRVVSRDFADALLMHVLFGVLKTFVQQRERERGIEQAHQKKEADHGRRGAVTVDGEEGVGGGGGSQGGGGEAGRNSGGDGEREGGSDGDIDVLKRIETIVQGILRVLLFTNLRVC